MTGLEVAPRRELLGDPSGMTGSSPGIYSMVRKADAQAWLAEQP